jgi:hypothetical protein
MNVNEHAWVTIQLYFKGTCDDDMIFVRFPNDSPSTAQISLMTKCSHSLTFNSILIKKKKNPLTFSPHYSQQTVG